MLVVAVAGLLTYALMLLALRPDSQERRVIMKAFGFVTRPFRRA